MNEGAWIFLLKKLPTEVAPPALSIHWSVPWVNRNALQHQQEGWQVASDHFGAEVPEVDETTERVIDPLGFGFEPNEAGARALLFEDEFIRVYPHEFSLVQPEHLSMYILGTGMGDASHVLEPLGTAGDHAFANMDSTLYDAGLIDGLGHQGALILALGGDPTPDAFYLPPVVWLKIHPEYGLRMGLSIGDMAPRLSPKRGVARELGLEDKAGVVWS